MLNVTLNTEQRGDIRDKLRPAVGHSRTQPADGGGLSAPVISQTTGRILYRKQHSIVPGLNFPKMLQNCICDVTVDVTGRVKGKVIDFAVLADFAGQSSRIKLK